MLDQGVERTVPGKPSRGEHARVGETAGEEAVGDGREAGTVAGQVEQRRRRRPPDGRDEQVALDALAAAERDAPDAPVLPATAALGLDDVAAGSGVDDADDVDAGAAEVVDRGITLVVGGQDDRPLAGPHRPEVDEAADGRREQHAGLVVALEHIGALDQPGCDDEGAGTDLDEPLEHGPRWRSTTESQLSS